MLDFRDKSYDGQIEAGTRALSKGLGQLTDGITGGLEDIFKPIIDPTKKDQHPSYPWIGWKRSKPGKQTCLLECLG